MENRYYRLRTKRQARRWQRKLERFRRIQKLIEMEAPEILESENFRRMKEYIQHGDMTVNARGPVQHRIQ